MKDLTIKVDIANRPYRLKIKSEEEEESVRKSAEHIESLIDEHSGRYHYNDHQDLLAMIALQLANNSLSLEKHVDYRDNDLVDKLKEIDLFLSSKVS
ncbi:MAG: cell division protein ZapA [Bacteroidales bacterium]|nr:cell division protein ZapA [Bacteroidales bacterium]